jgi:TPR repeat protein
MLYLMFSNGRRLMKKLLFAVLLCLSGAAFSCNDKSLSDTQNFNSCKKAAEQGDAKAQYSLGVMYLQALDTTQAHKWWGEAAKGLRKAAERGDADAQNKLALMYDYGMGVESNGRQAVKWYTEAAEQGYATAQSNLAKKYRDGQGVTQDYIQAHKWFNISGALGDKDATKERDSLARKMASEQIHEAQRLAREWMEEYNQETTLETIKRYWRELGFSNGESGVQ